ncbi:MAG: glycosyltransferase family 4 protein [Bdellovibrionales bacterium]
MKILILTQYFWPENFQINDLAEGLRVKGHQVEVLTGKPNYPHGKFFKGYRFLSPMREMFGEIPVFRAPLIPRFRSKGWQLILNYFSFVFFASLFVPWIGRRRYDLVLVFEPSPIFQALPAILLKKIYKTPVALWVLDLWPESLEATGAVRNSTALRLVGQVVNYIYRQCDLILASSENFIPKIRERSGAKTSISYFPNWADPLFESSKNSLHSQNKEQFHLTFAGNIGKAQSFETILKAAKILKNVPEIRWQIYGDGREKKWAEQTVNEWGLADQVIFHGMKPLANMPEIFSRSDALLITLKNDPVFKLTVPAKLQAYMACGRPIIASIDGEGAEIIHTSKSGFVSPAEDAEALAECVLSLHKLDPASRQSLGQNGRRHYEQHFARNKLFDKIEDLFQKMTVENYNRS